MPNVHLIFRIDIGFDEARGYAAAVFDVANNRHKGIRGNSMEQVASRLRHVLIEEMNRRKYFPHESEAARSLIITPDNPNP